MPGASARQLGLETEPEGVTEQGRMFSDETRPGGADSSSLEFLGLKDKEVLFTLIFTFFKKYLPNRKPNFIWCEIN